MEQKYTIPKTKEEKTTIEMARMETYNKLAESRGKRKVLYGVVEQCKPNNNASDAKLKVLAVVNFEGWKVLIPIGNLGLDLSHLDELEEDKKVTLYERYVISMLGTTVGFIVHQNKESIDSALRIAVGSREAAMKREQEAYYLKVNKASNKSKMEKAFEKGTIVKGRVVSTNKSNCFVEVYGKQVCVNKKEMSWRYVAEVSDVVRNNDIVNLKILNLAVNHETGEIDLEVSIKEAQENVVKNNMKMYTEGSTVLGVVSGISNGYWVQVGDSSTGIDVFCKKLNCSGIPTVGDSVAVKIFVMNHETGQIFGSIENITRRSSLYATI